MRDLGQVCDLCGELAEELYESGGNFVCEDCVKEEEESFKGIQQEKMNTIYFY